MSYFGDVIYSYSRADAIADGVLVDVTESAKEYGFNIPVAITKAVYIDCIDWDNNSQSMHQDEQGRLADLLWMCYLSARATKGSQANFQVLRIRKGATKPTSVKLKSLITGGDNGKPVITIMQLQED